MGEVVWTKSLATHAHAQQDTQESTARVSDVVMIQYQTHSPDKSRANRKRMLDALIESTED